MAIWLVRHGETKWTVLGRHTGSTDVALTKDGELQAVAIGKILAERSSGSVLSSPLRRAKDTARLAGFGELREYDYGEYEGLTTKADLDEEPGLGALPRWLPRRRDAAAGVPPDGRAAGGGPLAPGDRGVVRTRAHVPLDRRSVPRPPHPGCGTATSSPARRSSPTSPRRSPRPRRDGLLRAVH